MTGDEELVHVVDDDDAARDSLAFMLAAADLSVRTYSSAAAFLAEASSAGGCIVTDVRMPEIDGIELIRRLKALGVNLPVIVVTGQADLPLALEAIKLGASDFIEKPYRDDVLLSAVKSVLSGSGTDEGREQNKLDVQRRLATLTPVEEQVLAGLVSGQSNNAIADLLNTGQRAIEVHRATIMTKMQARNLSDLVRIMFLIGR